MDCRNLKPVDLDGGNLSPARSRSLTSAQIAYQQLQLPFKSRLSQICLCYSPTPLILHHFLPAESVKLASRVLPPVLAVVIGVGSGVYIFSELLS